LASDDILSAEISSAGATAGLSPQAGHVYFIRDMLGSVTDIANGQGEVVQSQEYLSFGKIQKYKDSSGSEITSPLIRTSFTFSGREYDSETGLFYFRARYYDGQTGRFIGQDPHSGELRKPLSVTNRYVYANNSPRAYIDPSGRRSILNWYGNYCGYDAKGQVYDQNGNVVPGAYAEPMDRLDQQCQWHDSAYADLQTATNLNWDDGLNRVQTDFGLVREGIEFSFKQPVVGLGVSVFGAVLLYDYSLRLLPLSMVIDGISSIFDWF
jgi:RHS repeat-associated protein